MQGDYFSDADGQLLRITASSSDTTVATVSETAGTVTITGKETGTATITVTATDDIAAPATQTFTVTVKNPPVAVGTIPDIEGPRQSGWNDYCLKWLLQRSRGADVDLFGVLFGHLLRVGVCQFF